MFNRHDFPAFTPMLAGLGQVDLTALLQVSAPVLIALLGGWFAHRQASMKAGSDAASGIQNGFQLLIKELQSENVKLVERLEKSANKQDEMQRKMDDVEKEMRRMARHIGNLELALSKAGLDIPNLPN